MHLHIFAVSNKYSRAKKNIRHCMETTRSLAQDISAMHPTHVCGNNKMQVNNARNHHPEQDQDTAEKFLTLHHIFLYRACNDQPTAMPPHHWDSVVAQCLPASQHLYIFADAAVISPVLYVDILKVRSCNFYFAPNC